MCVRHSLNFIKVTSLLNDLLKVWHEKSIKLKLIVCYLSYLLLEIHTTMKNYHSLDAHNFFISGWVQIVYHRKPGNSGIVFKADVKPSWRVTDPSHHTWVAVRSNGTVVAGHCDCMAR